MALIMLRIIAVVVVVVVVVVVILVRLGSPVFLFLAAVCLMHWT